MHTLRLSIFILGIILTILGWFSDRATNFSWLIRKIYPEYVNGIDVLNKLATNDKLAVNVNHPGFRVILDRWPNLLEKSSVIFIGRSVAYIEFGPQISNDFQLIAYDKDRKEITNRWKHSLARNLLQEELNKRLLWIGTTIFFIGIIFSFTSGLFEFLV